MATISFVKGTSGAVTVSHSDIDSGYPFTLFQIDQIKQLTPTYLVVQGYPTANRRFKVAIADDLTLDTIEFTPTDIDELHEWLRDSVFPNPEGGSGSTTTNASLLTSGILPDTRLSGNIPRIDDLSSVAFSGDYDDLINTPTIGTGEVTLTGSQTLTNKTLTAPVINSPTGIVKADVGLSNVDNVADASKPVSTAQAAAIAVVQSDIDAHEALTNNPHSVTKTQVGLGNADNTSDVNKPVSTATQTALGLKADLVGGKVPEAQLPSYVDDVEEHANLAAIQALTGESGKIYFAIDTEISYRWTGSTFAPMSSSLALGETNGTAYRGDRGKTAYDHTLLTDNPHSVTKTQVGLSNVDNTADTAKPVSTAQQTALDLKANLASPTFTGTVSGITKTMVGLGSVDNTADTAKPVSTAQQTALDLKANLSSPTFTGTPTLPTGTIATTQTAGNSTTAIATTAFVSTATAAKANLASPTFTGTPTAPTAGAATNTTQIATTAHVFAERSNSATLTNKTLTSPVINTPTGIVKGDVGLGNVDNTSNATERAAAATLTNKSISGSANTLSNIPGTAIAAGDLEPLDLTVYALKAGATFTGDVIVPDEAYDATAWNGSLEVPTKNAVRDKIESLSVGGGDATLAGAQTFTGVKTFNSTVTAASAIARGQRVTGTLTAAANNDVLVGLDVAPTYTNGAFTGLQNYGIRVTGDLKLDAGSAVNGGTSGHLVLDNSRGLKTKNASGTIRDMFKLFSDNVFYIDNIDGDINIRGAASASRILLQNSTGNMGIGGVTSPTAKLHLPAGTTAASTAPLKFTSGSFLSTPETGAMEYNSGVLSFVRSGTTREYVLMTPTVNTVSPTSPNRTITVSINGTTYYIAAKTTND